MYVYVDAVIHINIYIYIERERYAYIYHIYIYIHTLKTVQSTPRPEILSIPLSIRTQLFVVPNAKGHEKAVVDGDGHEVLYIYIYIYMMCVHTHRHVYIYIYITFILQTIIIIIIQGPEPDGVTCHITSFDAASSRGI